MSKIFNWFFGSFFRTLGRVLVFIVLGYILFTFINIDGFKLPNLFGVLNVNALENLDNYTRPNTNGNYYFVNCTGADDCWNYAGSTNVSSNVVHNTSTITTNSNGYGAGFVFSTDELFIKDNYYIVKVLFTPSDPLITNKFTNSSVKLLVGSGNGEYNMPLTTAESVSSYVVDIQDGVDDYAGSYLVYVFKATSNGNHLFIRFTSSYNYTGIFYFLGYQVSLLGSSKDDTEVINAINGLNNGLNDINSNINNTNDKLNDINSSINDTSSPNLDGLNNSVGWLPSGPIDGILNLPLTFLNSLTTNLSKTCNAVNLPLPFVDKTLILPCVNSLYSQIDGLQVWINSISVIASAFILFRYLLNLYKWVDDTLTFRENNFIDNWSGV